MRSGLILLAALLISATISAQKPCGTMAYKDPWLTQFQRTLDGNTLRSSDTVLYVPITLHILGNDDGVGYFSAGRAMLAFCRLNEAAPLALMADTRDDLLHSCSSCLPFDNMIRGLVDTTGCSTGDRTVVPLERSSLLWLLLRSELTFVF